MLPGSNSTLQEVRAPAGRLPNGRPGAPGAVLWSGEAPAYLARVDEEKLEDGRQVLAKVTQLTAYLSEGAPSTARPGGDWDASIVLVRDLDDVSTRFTVIGYERKGQGTPADKIVLTLDDPVAA